MPPLSSSERILMNKKHWDAIAVRNWPKKADLRKQIRNGMPYLERMEPKLASYMRDVSQKKVFVLQFGDALVLLALAKKGAFVTGVDLSSEQVRLAMEAATYCGVDVNLVEADCQNLPESIPSSYFDLAVAESGIFMWIENLNAWMRNAHRVLRSSGKLIVEDFHPFFVCTKKEHGVLTVKRSYLDQGPEVYQPEENVPPGVEVLWKISDIVNATIDAGFHIDRLEEYYTDSENKEASLIPKYFLLVATKE